MIEQLKNEFLDVKVSSHGAELQNLVNRKNSLEYLWQGDPAHWGRRAPILFPIVGALKGGFFTVGNEKFPMGQHGFARDMEFELTEQNANTLTYLLASNAATLELFPYAFSLQIGYTLNENQLRVTYTVHNPSSKDLHCSIGAHPAFNCPLRSGEERSDYALVFEQPESIERQLITSGIRTGQTRPVLKNETRLPVSPQLFDDDALIFEGLNSESITIYKAESPILTMNFKGFPYFGIWSKSADSPFVCLEPWHGIADHQLHDQHFEKKEGIIRIKPNEAFHSEYTLTIH